MYCYYYFGNTNIGEIHVTTYIIHIPTMVYKKNKLQEKLFY